jgi:hypothetical protein
MFQRTVPGFVAGAVFAVAIAGGGAVAATGGKFILGKSNSAGTTTTLSAGRGPALSLKSTGSPALKVNNDRKVANLNADELDGLSAAAFARSNAKTGAFDFTGIPMDADQDGMDDTIVASAQCPAGSQMTGGGATDLTSSGITFINAPYPDETWVAAVVIDEPVVESADNVIASVVCYDADGGTLTGSYRKTPAASAAVPADLMAKVVQRAAARR